MEHPEFQLLVRQAMEGRREAWDLLLEQLYPRWNERFHGALGKDLRLLYETRDIIHSAFLEAFEGVGKLRSEAAFCSWIEAIIRHKITRKRRRNGKARMVRIDEVPEPRAPCWDLDPSIMAEEEYEAVLDAILHLFPMYPEHMAILFRKHLEGQDIPWLMRAFDRSESGIHEMARSGLKVLRSSLTVRKERMPEPNADGRAQ